MAVFESARLLRAAHRVLFLTITAALAALSSTSMSRADNHGQETAVGAERAHDASGPTSDRGRLDQLISTLCQVQGVIGPVPEDHPARPLVGQPVSGHAFWYTKIAQNEKNEDEDFCLFGEVFLNVGGVARYSELNPSTCKIVFDPTRRFGEIEFNLPGSPLSPTSLAFAMPIDPMRPVATGMDELVVSGTCLRKIEPPLVFVN